MVWTEVTLFLHLALGAWVVSFCMNVVNGMEVGMHEHQIDDMVRKLKPALKDPVKAKAILNKYWKTRMALVWEVEDVYRAANEREVALTDKEAITVLQMLLNQHNAQYGIKWEDLTTHIEDQVLGQKLTKAEIKRFVERDIITIHKPQY